MELLDQQPIAVIVILLLELCIVVGLFARRRESEPSEQREVSPYPAAYLQTKPRSSQPLVFHDRLRL